MTKTKARDYRARTDGWINGRRRKAGEIVELTPRAARYENVDPVEDTAPAGKASKTPATKPGSARK